MIFYHRKMIQITMANESMRIKSQITQKNFTKTNQMT